MTIVVESGEALNNSNSYASADDLATFAADRGVPLPASTQADREKLLVRAMDYLETLESQFVGERKSQTQALSWPRTSYTRDYGLPYNIVKAQMALAIAAEKVDLFPVADNSSLDVTRKTVGPITIEYKRSTRGLAPSIPFVNALMAEYVKTGRGILEVVRA